MSTMRIATVDGKAVEERFDAQELGETRVQGLVGTLFFFQAEDGIRDRNVTGVQTCALPISPPCPSAPTANGSPPAAWTGRPACGKPPPGRKSAPSADMSTASIASPCPATASG